VKTGQGGGECDIAEDKAESDEVGLSVTKRSVDGEGGKGRHEPGGEFGKDKQKKAGNSVDVHISSLVEHPERLIGRMSAWVEKRSA
jgi:hypothetical protein